MKDFGLQPQLHNLRYKPACKLITASQRTLVVSFVYLKVGKKTNDEKSILVEFVYQYTAKLRS